jgi:hypothetical protein
MKFAMLLSGDEAEFNQAPQEELDTRLKEIFAWFEKWGPAGWSATGTKPTPLFIGYLVGAALMAIGGLVAAFLGVDAERRSLEDIASPLTAIRARATEAAGKVRDRLGPGGEVLAPPA